MTKKQVIQFIVIFIFASIAYFIICFAYMIIVFGKDAVQTSNRYKALLEQYTDDENYFTVSGTLNVFCYTYDTLHYDENKGANFYFSLTYAENGEKQTEEFFSVIEYSGKILEQNNFIKDVTIGSSKFTVTVPKEKLDNFTVVELYIDGKCYLDYSIGKSNLIKHLNDYIR